MYEGREEIDNLDLPEMTFISKLPRQQFHLQKSTDSKDQHTSSSKSKKKVNNGKDSMRSQATSNSQTLSDSQSMSSFQTSHSLWQLTKSPPTQHDVEQEEGDLLGIDQLFIWIKWRTDINNSLAQDLLSQKYHSIDSMQTERLMKILARPGVYRYGIVDDFSTNLNEREFINFGIPRVWVDPARLTINSNVDLVPETDYN